MMAIFMVQPSKVRVATRERREAHRNLVGIEDKAGADGFIDNFGISSGCG
jgi:hypothetical protein